MELLAAAEAVEKTKLYTVRSPENNLLIDNRNAIAQLLQAKSELTPRSHRFITRIQACPNLKISYINTKENSAADALSRGVGILPAGKPKTTDDDQRKENSAAVNQVTTDLINAQKNKDRSTLTDGKFMAKVHARKLHEQAGHK